VKEKRLNLMKMNNINIYLEANPNPNSLKFVTDKMLVDEGIVKDYPDIESTSDSPIAKKLFEFDYVDRVFIMSNFITITKNNQIHWDNIKLELRNFIKKYIEDGKKIVELQPQKNKKTSPNKEIDKKIIQILDEYIKPAVEQDGGAIQFESFQKGKVKVSLQGACSGCPSSMITLKSGIEKLLKRFVPEVVEVVAEEV
jgi:Fe-S cluster biogenesis protein NfuA|tara:strand:- start:192 stop:785 length:594 start_codon:yes stop_codon:yes gene_type:complete